MIRSRSVVGATAGMTLGYIVWLVAISIGNATTTVSRWSLMVLMLSGGCTVCCAAGAWWLRRQRNYLWAAFALGLPILPVVLTLAVLTNIYL